MKLPSLPGREGVPTLRAPNTAQAAAAKYGAISQGVSQLGSQVLQITEKNADNEARLNAAERNSNMLRTMNTSRRELQNTYLNDRSLSMDDYLKQDADLT